MEEIPALPLKVVASMEKLPSLNGGNHLMHYLKIQIFSSFIQITPMHCEAIGIVLISEGMVSEM